MIKLCESRTIIREVGLFWQSGESCIGFENKKSIHDSIELVHPYFQKIELATHEYSVEDLDARRVVSSLPAMQVACVGAEIESISVIMRNDISWTLSGIP